MLFTPSDTLVLDTARLRVWQQDDDYAYSRELVPAQKSLMDWLGEQFNQFWESVFGTAFYQEYSSLMWILVGVFLVIGILLFLFYKHPELFMRSGRQAPLEYEVTEDTIYGVDFEREIARAMERKDYREAMRLNLSANPEDAERSSAYRLATFQDAYPICPRVEKSGFPADYEPLYPCALWRIRGYGGNAERYPHL